MAGPIEKRYRVEDWLRDHMYDPDDVVLGDQGLTDSQLPAFHALLDLIAPNWRNVFE
jgi:cbb3-type cytochrome oxidase cytochrome c subunit